MPDPRGTSLAFESAAAPIVAASTFGRQCPTPNVSPPGWPMC